MSEMFNRSAIGVRAHADGIKQANASSKTVRGTRLTHYR